MQAGHILLQEALPPLAHRGIGQSQLARNLHFVFPEALSKIILARLTNPDGRERDLANDSNCSRCSVPNTKAVFGRPIAIGTSIVHKRCPCRQPYYCHLFMGHYTRSPTSFGTKPSYGFLGQLGVSSSSQLF